MNKKDYNSRDKKPDIVELLIRGNFVICVLFMVAVYIYGQFFVENEDLYANQCELFDGVWQYTDSDGITRLYGSGKTIDIEYGEDVALKMFLPDEIGDGNCFFIRTDRNMDAYIGDELRNSYKINDSFFGPNVKPIWLSVTLRRTDAGKMLTIMHENYKSDTYTVSDVYIGNRLGFSVQLIHNNIYIIILGFALTVLGIVVTIIGIIYKTAVTNN